MELDGYLFSSSSCFERVKHLTVKHVVGNLLSLVISIVFPIVGFVSGTISGGISGQQSMCGFFRGALVGSITGGLLSIEVFETFRRLWLRDEECIKCLLYLVDAIGILVSGRLVRERIGPLMFNAVNSQVRPTVPRYDNFDTGGGCKGLSEDSIQKKIPCIKITTDNWFDSEGQTRSCSVCLEVFKVDEEIRKLPYCHHMFHAACIDQWLVIHGSCPLCRRNL